jgi:hypothetical protein
MATATQPLFSFGGTVPRKTLDLSGVAPMPVNPGMTGQQAILSRLQPQLDRQRTSLQTQLANQGLVSGGEAYTNAMTDFGNQENDARQQAILAGLTLDQNANQQGFGQAVQSGDFENNAQGQGFNQGLAGSQFAYQQGQDNRAIDAAQHNSMMSGLFGLGSSVGVPLLGKAFGLGGASAKGVSAGIPPIGTAASTAAPHAAGGITGALGLGGGAGLFGLGAATLPVIGGALAGGALIWKATQSHQTADKWVQGNQNPFDQTMQQIQQAAQSGQLPPEQAQQLVQQNAQSYLTTLKQFIAKGGKQKTVGNQALATFRRYYGEPSQYGVTV